MSSPHLCLFFFSSRRRHTRSTRDWSSDVCSSDLDQMKQAFYNVIKNSLEAMHRHGTLRIRTDMDDTHVIIRFVDTGGRSEERRVGKECRLRAWQARPKKGMVQRDGETTQVMDRAT